MTPEARLTRKIIISLKRRGGWWLKVHGGPMQQRGVPDIIGAYRGRFVAMEVKLPNGRSTLSRAQAVVIRRIRDAEAIARVVTSVLDASNLLDEIDTAIDEQG